MNKATVKDWFLFGEWHGLYSFHACYYDGVVNTTAERLGQGLSQFFIEQEGGVYSAYVSRQEWTNLGKNYLEDILQDHKKLSNILNETRDLSNDLIKFSRKLKKTSIKNLNNKELLKLLENCHRHLHPVWALGMVPNVLELENSFLSDYLKDWLSKQDLLKEQQFEIFQALATPSELSAAQKEERGMLALASKENFEKELKKHHDSYSWLHFGWTGPSLDLGYFKSVHEGLYKEGNAAQLLKEILQKDSQLAKDKKKYGKDLNMPNDIEDLFYLLEDNLFIKAYRMDAIYMCYEACQPLLKKIASNFHLSLSQVYSLYFDDIVKGIKENNFDVDWINAHAKYSATFFDGEKSYLLMNDEARKLSKEIRFYLPKVEAVSEIKGETAFPGKVKGRVSVVNLATEMHKFSDGDILVSNVTDPSLLPIMKKAKAFVTNMGGLTCHAAIVARELEVPCVIGTKIATNVLQDGDMIEVDATNGVVRKL